jgi:hypothetical protein
VECITGRQLSLDALIIGTAGAMTFEITGIIIIMIAKAGFGLRGGTIILMDGALGTMDIGTTIDHGIIGGLCPRSAPLTVGLRGPHRKPSGLNLSIKITARVGMWFTTMKLCT